MLYIRQRTDGTFPTELEWHVGEANYDVHPNHVEVLQADGDELQHILSKFSNLPVLNDAHVMRWYGDIAKTIAWSL